jgi:hypothetical protein
MGILVTESVCGPHRCLGVLHLTPRWGDTASVTDGVSGITDMYSQVQLFAGTNK